MYGEGFRALKGYIGFRQGFYRDYLLGPQSIDVEITFGPIKTYNIPTWTLWAWDVIKMNVTCGESLVPRLMWIQQWHGRSIELTDQGCCVRLGYQDACPRFGLPSVFAVSDSGLFELRCLTAIDMGPCRILLKRASGKRQGQAVKCCEQTTE